MSSTRDQTEPQGAEQPSIDTGANPEAADNKPGATEGTKEPIQVIYKFCDINKQLCTAWETHFKDFIPDRVHVYKGDIFKEGPAADAIVSPANSFGFMDGGIDMAYSRHFGWQMQERLQKVIRTEYDGELLVGQAAIIPAVEGWVQVDWSKYNEGQPIKWLVSAPTMRVPIEVDDTANSYLAFRAVILAVNKHNKTPGKEPIRSVLCPGLGTAVGRMPSERCAYQMLYAYETYVLGENPDILEPSGLGTVWHQHVDMAEYGPDKTQMRNPQEKASKKAVKSSTTAEEKPKES